MSDVCVPLYWDDCNRFDGSVTVLIHSVLRLLVGQSILHSRMRYIKDLSVICLLFILMLCYKQKRHILVSISIVIYKS